MSGDARAVHGALVLHERHSGRLRGVLQTREFGVRAHCAQESMRIRPTKLTATQRLSQYILTVTSRPSLMFRQHCHRTEQFPYSPSPLRLCQARLIQIDAYVCTTIYCLLPFPHCHDDAANTPAALLTLNAVRFFFIPTPHFHHLMTSAKGGGERPGA